MIHLLLHVLIVVTFVTTKTFTTMHSENNYHGELNNSDLMSKNTLKKHGRTAAFTDQQGNIAPMPQFPAASPQGQQCFYPNIQLSLPPMICRPISQPQLPPAPPQPQLPPAPPAPPSPPAPPQPQLPPAPPQPQLPPAPPQIQPPPQPRPQQPLPQPQQPAHPQQPLPQPQQPLPQPRAQIQQPTTPVTNQMKPNPQLPVNGRNPNENVIKTKTVITISKDCEDQSPIDRIKNLNPELGKEIEHIFDYHGISKPWDAYADLKSPKPRPLPNWCNMFKTVRGMLKVFESIKEMISDQFLTVKIYIFRGKEYMCEYVENLKHDLDLMVVIMKRMREAKDYNTKSEYMGKFVKVYCATQQITCNYKNLRSWVLHVIKAFSGLFFPYNVNKPQ